MARLALKFRYMQQNLKTLLFFCLKIINIGLKKNLRSLSLSSSINESHLQTRDLPISKISTKYQTQ